MIEYCSEHDDGLNIGFTDPGEAARYLRGKWQVSIAIDPHITAEQLAALHRLLPTYRRRSDDGMQEISGTISQQQARAIIGALLDLHDEEPNFSEAVFEQGTRRVIFTPHEEDFYFYGFSKAELDPHPRCA
jgi:hypothetical protein